MSADKSILIRKLFRAIILFGFAMYIAHLVKTDSMVYYIAPRMADLVKYSALALYAMSLHQVYSFIRAMFGQIELCDCEQPVSRSLFIKLIASGLFILPLLLGFFMPDTVMSSALAAKKGMNLNNVGAIRTISSSSATNNATKVIVAAETPTPAIPSATPNPSDGNAAKPADGTAVKSADGTTTNTSGGTGAKSTDGTASQSPAPKDGSSSSDVSNPQSGAAISDAKLKKMFATDDYNADFAKLGMILYKKDKIEVKEPIFMEILQSVDLFKANFIGKTIEMSGFVYREDNMKSNQLVVGRFAISCCSADASPYGVLVEFDQAKNYPKDTWVSVTGTVGQTTFDGNDIMKIDVTDVKKIKAPKSPYVYPNYDFLSQ